MGSRDRRGFPLRGFLASRAIATKHAAVVFLAIGANQLPAAAAQRRVHVALADRRPGGALAGLIFLLSC